MANALKLAFALLGFSVVFTGMGFFVMGTLSEYGITHSQSDINTINSASSMLDTIDDMRSTLQSGTLDTTNFLGVVMSVGTMAWNSLKLMFNMVNMFTTLPTEILVLVGMPEGTWIVGFIAAAVTLLVVKALLEANLKVSL